MTTIPSNLRRVLRREPRVRPTTEPVAAPPERVEAPPVEIAPNDPLVAYFSGATGAVDIGALQLDSPALEGLREAGIKLVVPLVSQGELIGLLNLGPRRSEQEYSADDRKLLNDLAGHAAPAVRVAQLVREQEAEVRQRERIEQELRVAQLIQQQFLPQELPDLPGWQVGAYYGRPARSAATSTTSSSCPTTRSASWSATSPTRASRRRWSWPPPTRSCGPRRPAWSPPARS